MRALPGQRAVGAWTANTGGCFSDIVVEAFAGRSWSALGSPRRIGVEGCTHSNEPTLVARPDGGVLLAWEEAESNNPRSLYAQQWANGEWHPMGPALETGAFYGLDPHLALHPTTGEPWLVWEGGKHRDPQVRVSRWSAEKWQQVGGLVAQGVSPAKPRLAFALGGRPFVAWLRGWAREKGELKLSSWDGSSWQTMDIAVGKATRLGGPPALLRASDDALLVAWAASETNWKGGFGKVYVKRWDGTAWSTLVDGLGIGPPPSDAADVQLARGAGDDVFVVWDQPADDERRLRAARLYRCAPGERPSPMQSTPTRDSLWPRTVDEAVERLLKEIDADGLEKVRRSSKDDLGQFHMGFGLYIRNRYGLWGGNEALLKSCDPKKPIHPDDCSHIIIESLWVRLQKQ